MRKHIAVLLSILLIFSLFLSSCGKEDTPGVPPETSAAITTPAAETTPAPVQEPLPGESPVPFHIAPAAFDDISVTPLTTGENKTVAADTAFLISPSVETDLSQLSQALTLNNNKKTPAEFSLTENEEGNFLLAPSAPLSGGTVYTLRYEAPGKSPLSFAFQTEDGFHVESTLPGETGYSVPVNTGIEITFNAACEGGLEDYFSISPFVSGRWEQTGNTYVYVPAALQYSTAYTVTVKGGADGVHDAEGRFLAGDYVFTFTTEWSGEDTAYFSVFGGEYETFLPQDEVFVELNVSRELADAEYAVDVYQIESPAAFLNSATTGELLESFTTPLSVTDSGYQQRYYLPAGKTYPQGYYRFDITTNVGGQDYSCRKWIQVSQLSVYTLSLNGELAVWVNDVATGQPAKNARLETRSGTRPPGAGEYTVNGQGVAVIPAPETGTVLISVPDVPAHVFQIPTYAKAETAAGQNYYRYLYTDRSVYLPDDTIRVFGVINARYEEDLLTGADELTLKLGDIKEISVTPDRYGAFEAAFTVSGMRGGTDVSLLLNGGEIYSKWVDFGEYARDKYNFTVETDRTVYYLGETINVNASVSTLDGAPAQGLTVANVSPAFSEITDAGGNAAISYEATAYQYYNNAFYDWQPDTSYNWATLLGRVENSQEARINTVVLPSTVMLEYEQPARDSIVFSSSLIDRDALEDYFKRGANGDSFSAYGLEDVFRGEAHDMDITLKIIEETYTPTNPVEYYNFIQKKNIIHYDYIPVDRTYSETVIATENGKATVTGLPISNDPMVSYYAEVSFTDTAGNPVGFSVRIGPQGYSPGGGDTMYAIRRNDSESAPGLNETSLISLYDVYAPETEVITEGKLLIIPATDSIKDAYTGKPDGTAFTFTEEYIYNAQLFGAYFDGKYVFATQYPINIPYGTDEAKLDIDITFDREDYKPGEEVSASVAVKDHDGRPARARVAISVVDEAVLRANPNDPNFLYSYYQNMYNSAFPFSTYTSFTPHDGYANYGGAEMGDDGGAASIRHDFNDNPAFFMTETDASGKGRASFTLSDAVTSWRVTALAMAGGHQAGDAKANVFAGLPFYIDMVMTDTFLVGDELAVFVKPFGEEYRFNQTDVSYTADLLQNGAVIDSLTSESAAAVTMNFGKRPAGEYAVRVSAKAAGYTDAMEEKVSVADSDARLTLTRRHVINEASPALSTHYDIIGQPVNVTFTNGDIGPLTDILRSTQYDQSDRTDDMAARAFHTAFWDGERAINGAVDARLAQALNYSSAMAELTYGEPDLMYTARFAAAFPELMDKAGLVSYAKPFLSDENEINRAAAYFVLAAAGENILTDLYGEAALLERSESYESRLRVLLYASAFCAIGDDGMAKTLMEDFDGTALTGSDDAGRETLSNLEIYIQTVTDPPKAFERLQARLTSPNQYVSDVCEKINFLKKVVPVTGVESEISYVLNGGAQTAKLNNFERVSLDISIEQYNALNVKRVSGSTNVDVRFVGSPQNLDANLNQMTITKEVIPMQIGDETSGYRIVLTISDPGAEDLPWYYTVYDRVPSNMRYVDFPASPYVTLSASRDKETGGFTASYFAELVSDAEAVIPPAYVSRSFDLNETWGVSR